MAQDEATARYIFNIDAEVEELENELDRIYQIPNESKLRAYQRVVDRDTSASQPWKLAATRFWSWAESYCRQRASNTKST